ncbi:MAG: patatin family protein [Actinomycetia bacterium]|nr:patatin family protein [Actinomycetes bacterium]
MTVTTEFTTALSDHNAATAADPTALFPGLNQLDYPPAWLHARLVPAWLVLEGGAMRGQFTAGILDCLMDQQLIPTTMVGVSAGALNGVNYTAGQRGRTAYLNIRYAHDRRYYSLLSWFLTGNVFSVRYSFREIPEKLVLFDFAAFQNSPIRMISVATDLSTGQADYHCYQDLRAEMAYLQASASMPFFSRVVPIAGRKFLDGGIAESVPLRYALDSGAKKLIVILTQPADYLKPPNPQLRLAQLVYYRYPQFVKALARRHLIYNAAYQQTRQMAADGQIFLFQPSGDHPVSHMEKDRGKLLALYQEGYTQAASRLPELQRYLNL